MNKFEISKPNGHSVACASEVPENAKHIVIAIHGFTSSKESPTVQLLMQKLPEAGIGVIGIDLPAHGVEASYQEELRIENCINSVEAAEHYVTKHYPHAEVCYFASSFGAYITALYLSTRPHSGRKAFFRSAAVNMPSLFIKENMNEEELRLFEELREKGYFWQGFGLGHPIKVTSGFIEDLSKTDLFELFSPNRFGRHSIAMAHGAEDDVIDPAEAARFARTFGIPETVFAGEGHSLSNHPETPGKVADLAIALYLA